MNKLVLDTNILIDNFRDPQKYHDIITSNAVFYLSSVVAMELKAGAHTKESSKAVNDLIAFFKKADRILVPVFLDYVRAGDLLATLQREKGYDLKKTASLASDCLIATSSRSVGATVITQNRRDFAAIREFLDFKVKIII